MVGVGAGWGALLLPFASQRAAWHRMLLYPTESNLPDYMPTCLCPIYLPACPT